MLTPSEEVTRTWIKRKGLLIRNRPPRSRFSFLVCLSIVFSIGLGFLGGFITAGFALSENYSSVYESLLAELENTRRCIEREKDQLMSAKNNQLAPVQEAALTTMQPSHQMQEQAILNVFGHAIELLSKNNKAGACAELNNIININEYSGKWKKKAHYLIKNNCD